MTEFDLKPIIDNAQSLESPYRRPAWVEVDLEAVRHNVAEVRKVVGKSVRVMAVVKADGYGHGAVYVARAALEAGADWLGVALPEEAAELRDAGIDAPVLILSEPPATAAGFVLDCDCSATVSTLEVAKALNEAAALRGTNARLHLKIDTGMNRIGVPVSKAAEIIEVIQSLPHLEMEGIFTHFAKADDPLSDLTDLQLDKFLRVVSLLPEDMRPMKHAANSAATFTNPRSHLDMVRIGIALYGLHPSEATIGRVDLKPAFSLKARASLIKEVAAGEGVSYGHTHLTDRRTTLVTIPVGYGDGYSRRLSNAGAVLIGGKKSPIVGNVCMDQFMVDAGPNAPHLQDEVVLIGSQGNEQITADEIADLLGTINYEVVCMVNKRVPRIYLNE